MNARALIAAYYDAFNTGDTETMLGYVADDVEHYVNEGGVRKGRGLFRAFNAHMAERYRESLTEIVIFASDDNSRAAAEFIVNGTYLKTDAGLPEATGQTYRLPAGAFFDIRGGKITRITTYYNLAEWIRQVS